MFKSMLRAGLTAALIMGMAAVSFAYDLSKGLSVTGSFKEYFGHYDTGLDGYSSRFENRGEANLGFKIDKEYVSAYIELEVRDFDSAKGAPKYIPELQNPFKPLLVSGETRNDPYALQRWVQFQSGKASLRFGTIVNTETLGFTVLGATRTFSMYSMGATGGGALANFVEGDGVRFGYDMNENFKVGFTFLSNEVILFNHVAPGKTVQLTLSGKIGSIMWKAAHTQFTADDNMDNDIENITDTGQLLGIRIPVSKKLIFSVDYSQQEFAKDSPLRAIPFVLSGLGVPTDVIMNSKSATSNTLSGQLITIGLVGYGALIFTYGQSQVSIEGEKKATVNDLNIVYDMPLEHSLASGLQFTFLQRERSVPESYDGHAGAGKVGKVEGYTSQFIGTGIYANF